MAYGYVLAELGKIAEAIDVFVGMEKLEVLSANDYRSLAGWHKALGSAEREQAALVHSLELQNEWALSQWLQRQYSRYSRAGSNVPEELDARIPRMFRVLLSKAEHPQNHFWMLSNYYGTTRDFRLLEGMSEGLLGHTAQKIYPFLKQVI